MYIKKTLPEVLGENFIQLVVFSMQELLLPTEKWHTLIQ